MIPLAMAMEKQWVCWRTESRHGKPTKVPYDPMRGDKASSTDPATWSTLAVAEVRKLIGKYDGIGFVFRSGGGLFGIDLDGCIHEGEVAPWAMRILDGFKTYAEISPSGTGIKLFGRAAFDRQGKTKWMAPPGGEGKRPRIEVYGWGRYFAVTGEAFTDLPVADCSGPLEELLKELWPPPKVIRIGVPGVNQRAIRRAHRYVAKVPPTVCGSGICESTTCALACTLTEFGLAMDDAYPILAEWAAKSTHGWSEQALRRKLDFAKMKCHAA